MKAFLVSLALLLCSIVKCDICPPNYKQGKDGGDCYRVLTYYDSFFDYYYDATFDSAEAACSSYSGGLLASIHSQEEQDAIFHLGCSQMYRNIGLRCVGTDCRWDDGTPLDFTNFYREGPLDDGEMLCYFLDVGDGIWKGEVCGTYTKQCWICRVKAQTMQCNAGETAYRGGCVSVHTTPLDQKSAESSCPGSGHLVSIHSVGTNSEGDMYRQLAVDAGVKGTIYIGLRYINGVYEWSDGSRYGADYFAKGFPDLIFGSCVQMMLDSEFGSQGQWTNIDCSTRQAFMCFRDGSTTVEKYPKADERCPPVQYFTESGTIYSPNYPLSIPSQQTCEYVVAVSEGNRATLKFNSYNCQGTSLSLYDGMNSNSPFKIFTTTSPMGQTFTATTNVIKIVFTANGTSPVGTGWEAEFNEI